jgi:hypothetical protein
MVVAHYVAKVEHNTFQLERLSSMGRSPAAFGLGSVRSWPWESVMEWQLAAGESALAG